ncbi:unnamed protein product [Prunus armeniaca]|uniref:Uncharacterized protein n=1 Tax=Prunus armeniaca TaxID=36596 RepID=A0A6J5UEA7_PRUAR|nr:unnamed protein product [Prunus armeniaca]
MPSRGLGMPWLAKPRLDLPCLGLGMPCPTLACLASHCLALPCQALTSLHLPNLDLPCRGLGMPCLGLGFAPHSRLARSLCASCTKPTRSMPKISTEFLKPRHAMPKMWPTPSYSSHALLQLCLALPLHAVLMA